MQCPVINREDFTDRLMQDAKNQAAFWPNSGMTHQAAFFAAAAAAALSHQQLLRPPSNSAHPLPPVSNNRVQKEEGSDSGSERVNAAPRAGKAPRAKVRSK